MCSCKCWCCAVPCQLSSCRRVKCRLFAAELCSVELRVRRLSLGRCKYRICYAVNGTLLSTCYLIWSFPKLETIPSAAFATVSLALVAAPRAPTEQVGGSAAVGSGSRRRVRFCAWSWWLLPGEALPDGLKAVLSSSCVTAGVTMYANI